MQKIILQGRLGNDAEVKSTQSGKQFVTFRMATNVRRTGQNGVENVTYWWRINSFNAGPVAMAQYLKKGKPVIVIGQYTNSLYNNPQSGLVTIDNDVLADVIDFVDSENPNNQNNGQGGVQQPQQQQSNFRQPTTGQTAQQGAVAPKPASQANAATAPVQGSVVATPAPAAAPSGSNDDPTDDLPF